MGRGSTLLTVGSRSALRRTATTPMPHFAGVTEAGPCSWRWTGGGSLDAVAGHGGTIFPLISCPSWSPEAPRGHEEQLDKIQKTSGRWPGTRGWRRPRLWPNHVWSLIPFTSIVNPAGTPHPPLSESEAGEH